MESELAKLKQQRLERAKAEAVEDAIIAMLPDDLPKAPTISNVRGSLRSFDDVAAWLSFSAPSYDPKRTWKPVAVLESPERAGGSR
jgi:hypothetical protein